MSDEEAPVVSGEKKRGRPAGDKEKVSSRFLNIESKKKNSENVFKFFLRL